MGEIDAVTGRMRRSLEYILDKNSSNILLSDRSLLVSIYHLWYPINEDLLCQIFSAYGKVEKITVLRNNGEEFQALLQFDSIINSVVAKQALHGRSIYEGCCILDVQFPNEEHMKLTEASEVVEANLSDEVSAPETFNLLDNDVLIEKSPVQVLDVHNDEIVEDNGDDSYSCAIQMEELTVVDCELMKNSCVSNVSNESFVKQDELVTLIKCPPIGFGTLNPLGKYGDIEGANIKVNFDPGGTLKVIVLGLVNFLNPKDIDDVFVRYEALLEDGTFVSESNREEFTVKNDYFCPALAKIVKTMKKGEKVLLTVNAQYASGEIALITIQPEYAFGKFDFPQELTLVPGNSAVYYDVEMVSFVRDKDSRNMNTQEKIKVANGQVWQRVNNDFASSLEMDEGGELMSLSDISSSVMNTAAKLLSTSNKEAADQWDLPYLIIISDGKFPVVAEAQRSVQLANEMLDSLIGLYRKQLQIHELEYMTIIGVTHLIELFLSVKVSLNWMKVNSIKKIIQYHLLEVLTALDQLPLAKEELSIVCRAAWGDFFKAFCEYYVEFQATVQTLASLDCLNALAIRHGVLNAGDCGSVMKMVGHVLQELKNPENNNMSFLIVGINSKCYTYWGVSKEINKTLFSVLDPMQKLAIVQLMFIQHYGRDHKRTLAEMVKKATSVNVVEFDKRVQEVFYHVEVKQLTFCDLDDLSSSNIKHTVLTASDSEEKEVSHPLASGSSKGVIESFVPSYEFISSSDKSVQGNPPFVADRIMSSEMLRVLPCFILKTTHENFCILYVHHESWLEFATTLLVFVLLWTYDMVVFLSTCVLFHLACNLQIIHFDDYARLLERMHHSISHLKFIWSNIKPLPEQNNVACKGNFESFVLEKYMVALARETLGNPSESRNEYKSMLESRKQVTAYIHDLKYVPGDFIVIMDADLFHHPKYLPKFIKKLMEIGVDVAFGTHYVKGGGVHGWNLMCKLTSKGANLLAQTLLWPDISDLSGSFQLYQKSVLEDIISSCVSKGYVFQMEVIVCASRKHYHIEQVLITSVDKGFGSSKLGELCALKSSITHFRSLRTRIKLRGGECHVLEDKGGKETKALISCLKRCRYN